MAGRSGADETVALIQTGHATTKREPGISGRLMKGEEGTTKTLTKTTRSACDATKGRTRGRFARVMRRRRSTARTTCRSTAAATRGMKEVGTTRGVYGRLFGVLAWVERVIEGEVLRRARRGELGRETLICGNDTTGASGPARRKLASTPLVDSWETANCLPTRDTVGNRFPIGKVKATNLQTTRRERERERERDPR
jgi:hypothetical protein